MERLEADGRRKMGIVDVTISIALLMLTSGTAPTVRRDDAQHCVARGDDYLRLDYAAFDQSRSFGWRSLSDACPSHAQRMIERYLRRNLTSLAYNQVANLHFHAAQLALKQNRIVSGGRHLTKSIVAVDTGAMSIDWNTYVRATIAFVRHDRKSFLQLKRRLGDRAFVAKDCEENAPCKGADPNYPVAVRLDRCWGRPYAVAYYRC
jgi:hypothetical protein